MTESRYYQDIKQVQEARSVEDVNKLLSAGFEILRIGEESIPELGKKEAQTRLVYVLGRRTLEAAKPDVSKAASTSSFSTKGDQVAAKAASSSTSSLPTKDQAVKKDPIVPKSITWTAKTESFAWAFTKDKEGNPIPEASSFAEKLKDGPLEEAGFKYSLSKDGKFLQRVKTHKK